MAKTLKQKLDYHKYRHKVFKDLKEHYEELYKVSVGELHFANMQKAFYGNTLEEIENMTTDPLAKKVIENTRERNDIDKLVHARNLFPEPETFNE